MVMATGSDVANVRSILRIQACPSSSSSFAVLIPAVRARALTILAGAPLNRRGFLCRNLHNLKSSPQGVCEGWFGSDHQ